MSAGPRSTLVLLVTCSRDESRRDLAVEVTRNLAALVPQAALKGRFIVFDNGSTFTEHLDLVPAGTVVCRASENGGYWSAIKWALEHRAELTDAAVEYLYIVESDLWHSDLRPLTAAEAFLAATPSASCVRTQEFSVRSRWRFDKRLRRLPFHVVRSQVSLENGVTGERAWFRRSTVPGIYRSNLHAKLPALNRLSALDRVFDQLGQLRDFTEADFFRLTMADYPEIGVLDGGLFHSLISWDDRHTVISGSYGSPSALSALGYQPTRRARITSLEGLVRHDLVTVGADE
jgi:hypothetical protein